MVYQEATRLDTVLDEWVLTRYLKSKKPLEAFEYIPNGDSYLIVTEHLPRNQVKCIQVNEAGFSPVCVRRIKTNEDKEQYLYAHGAIYLTKHLKSFVASKFVTEQVVETIEAMKQEVLFLDDGVVGRRQQRLKNLQIEVLKGNFNNLKGEE